MLNDLIDNDDEDYLEGIPEEEITKNRNVRNGSDTVN